jgi:streptogrisin C
VAATSAGALTRVQEVAGRLGVRVQTHLVARSYAALQRQAESLSGRAGIDVAANRVVTDPTAAASRRELDACTSRLTCDTTVRAGVVLRHYGLPICSAGFTARTAAGQRYVYTAGHCDIIPGPWSFGGKRIGPMAASRQDGAVDAAIIRVDNPALAGDLGGEAYEENSEHSVPLNGVASAMSELQQGDIVCLAANFSQVNGANLCGVIGSVSDPAELGMVRVDGLDACTGDSGGGWYWLASTTYRVAFGLHHDSDPGCHGDSGGSHSWFSPIPEVSAVWGLTVETSAGARLRAQVSPM